jgi:surface antigen
MSKPLQSNRRTHSGCLWIGSLLFAIACSAHASNLNFLNDTPLSYMKQQDIDSIKMAVTKVLDTKEDGQTSHWNNSGTRNSVKLDAVLTPNDTTRKGDRTCRSVEVALNAKGQSMDLHPLFCRVGTAAWKLQQRK